MKTKTQTKKQSIPIGPEAVIERPPEQKYQDMVAISNVYARNITKIANSFVYRQNNPEFARLYITYRQLLGTLSESMKKYFPEGPKLDELPALKDNVLLGMFALADYCKGYVVILTGKLSKPANRKDEQVRKAMEFMEAGHPEHTEKELLCWINKTYVKTPEGRPYKTMTEEGLRKAKQRIASKDNKTADKQK